jgi:hypothetical protein
MTAQALVLVCALRPYLALLGAGFARYTAYRGPMIGGAPDVDEPEREQVHHEPPAERQERREDHGDEPEGLHGPVIGAYVLVTTLLSGLVAPVRWFPGPVQGLAATPFPSMVQTPADVHRRLVVQGG